MVDFDNRGQKSVDIASTYIQVLIGLASGIITAVLAFYSDISKITNFDLPLLKISLGLFGISIGGGLLGLGALVNSIANSNNAIPTNSSSVMAFVTLQFVAFGLGITLVILSLP